MGSLVRYPSGRVPARRRRESYLYKDKARNQIKNIDLLISPTSYDQSTIKYPASQILADLTQQIGLSVCQLPFVKVVRRGNQDRWTANPGTC